MNRKNNIILGIILVALGVGFILNNYLALNISIGNIISLFWATIFLIIPSVVMHILYFTGKSRTSGVTFLAGLLLGIGINCQVSMYYNIWNLTWPCYIMAFCLGLLEWYIFEGKNKWKLYMAAILGAFSLVFFMTHTLSPILKFWFGDYIISAVCIVSGLAVIIFNIRPSKKQTVNG